MDICAATSCPYVKCSVSVYLEPLQFRDALNIDHQIGSPTASFQLVDDIGAACDGTNFTWLGEKA